LFLHKKSLILYIKIILKDIYLNIDIIFNIILKGERMRKIVLLLMLSISFVFASINLQTASKQELMSIKGIGPKKAQQIIKYRKTNKIKSADDLKNIKGFGAKLIANVKANKKVSKVKLEKKKQKAKAIKEKKKENKLKVKAKKEAKKSS